MNDRFDDIPDYESDELNEPSYEPDEPECLADEEEEFTDEFTEDSEEVEPVDEFMEDDTNFDKQNEMEDSNFDDEPNEDEMVKDELRKNLTRILGQRQRLIDTEKEDLNDDKPDEDGSAEDGMATDELDEDESVENETIVEELNKEDFDEEESAYEDDIVYATHKAYEGSASENNRPWENNNSTDTKSIAILLGIIAIIITIIITFGMHIAKSKTIANITDKTEETVDEAEDIADETKDLLDSVFDDEPLFETSDYSKDFDDDNTVYFNGCKIVLRETTLSELGAELGVEFTEENTEVIEEFDDTAESMSYIETDGTEDIYIEGYYDGPATEDDIPNFVVTQVSFTVDSVESFDFFGVTQDSTPEEIVEAVGDPYLKSESYYGTEYTWVTTYTYLTIDYDENNEMVHIRVLNV